MPASRFRYIGTCVGHFGGCFFCAIGCVRRWPELTSLEQRYLRSAHCFYTAVPRPRIHVSRVVNSPVDSPVVVVPGSMYCMYV